MAVSPGFRVAALLTLALGLAASGALLGISPATSSAASTSSGAAGSGTLIRYHGTESRGVLPLGPERLPGAPASFRKYVKKELHRVWRVLGHYPNCKTSPEVLVHAIRTDGFALGAEVTRPRGPHCDGGGGAAYIWAIRKGQWKPVIATQDEWPCETLLRFGIPSEIGVNRCYDGVQVVPYAHP